MNLYNNYLIQLFKKLKEEGIHTCIDTSGMVSITKDIKELLKYTDLVLFDIKHINDDEHIKLTGMSNKNALNFARFLSNNNVKVWIRHVLVPDITLIDEYLIETKEFISTLSNVEKIEVLPYHKMGITKYEELGIKYQIMDIPEPNKEDINHAKELLGVKNVAK